MANNYIQPGDIIDHTLSGTVTSGDVVQIKDGFNGVALSSGSSGDIIAVAISGVFDLTKNTTTDVIEVGDPLYVDGDGLIEPVAEGSSFVGYAVKASSATNATVHVLLVRAPFAEIAANVAATGVTASGTYQQAEIQALADAVADILLSLKAASIMAAD